MVFLKALWQYTIVRFHSTPGFRFDLAPPNSLYVHDGKQYSRSKFRHLSASQFKILIELPELQNINYVLFNVKWLKLRKVIREIVVTPSTSRLHAYYFHKNKT